MISWTVLALAGGWAAYLALRRDLLRSGVAERLVNALFACEVLVWFGGAHAGQLLTVPGGGAAKSGLVQLFSGLVLYGGVVLALAFGAAFWAFCLRKRMGISEIWDSGTLALAWAMFFGRLGCTLYGCCYGSPSGGWPGYELNHARWDFETRAFPSGLEGVRLHPAPLYEALGWLALVIATYWMRRRDERAPGSFPPGVTAGITWISYAVMRFALEFIRLDPRGSAPLGLSPSQWIAIAFVPFCAWTLQRDFRIRQVPLRLRKPL